MVKYNIVYYCMANGYSEVINIKHDTIICSNIDIFIHHKMIVEKKIQYNTI